MKNLISFIRLLAAILAVSQSARADYPIASQRYLADPAAMVHNGRVYIYCSNDDDNPVEGGYQMKSLVCVSSSDMKNWTDHGEVIRVPAAAAWASHTWAPAAIERNGTFYLYFANNASNIGVATSTSPTGPFTDALGTSLINSSTPGAAGTNMWLFDPAVFIDDDNQAYLYFGGNGESNGRVIRLNENMTSVSGSATSITAPGFFEAAWMHKRNGIYYYSYSTNTANGLRIDYMTSDNPMTGFTYRGIVAGQPPSNNNNNHAAIFLLNGNWYHVYHNRSVATQAGIPTVYRRNLAVENLNYNVDGNIQQVAYTTNGVTQTANVDPYARVEAETMAGQSGIETEPCSEGGMNVTAVSNNDWVLVRGVNFGMNATGFSTRIAGTVGGAIELRLDSLAGPLIGTCSVPSTGGPQSWTAVTCPVNTATAQGVRDLYLKFTGTGDGLFNLNWWQFASSATLPPAPTGLTALLESNSQVTLSWTAAPGATGYRVKRSLNSGGPYTMIAENIAGTSYSDTAANRGLTYFYVISAITPPVESLNSNQVGLKVARLLSPVADAYVRDGGSAAINFGTAEDLAVKLDTTDFARESFLRFNVAALSNAASARLRLMPVSGSTDLATTQLNYEFMATDSWNETAVNWNNKPAGSGIVLGSVTGYGIGTPVEIDVTARTNTEAAGDGNLSLRMSAVVAGSGRIVSFGSRENPIQQNRPVIEYLLPGPAAPTGLTATPGSAQVSLAWTGSPGATSYLIKRATTPGGPYLVVASGIITTSHTDTGLANCQPYHYSVSAVNAENQGANSAEASVILGTDRFQHLRLDETSGTTATDSSGNSRNGTLVNGPVWVAGANAKVTGALSFDGSNDHVTFPAGLVSTLQDFTISTWVKLNSVSDFMRIFDFSSSANAYMFLTPRATDTQTARFGITLTGSSADQQRINGTASLPTGVWTHVAVTVSGTTGTLYAGVVQKRGFMMAQFSRFVRPGFVRIGTINQSPTTKITAFKNPTTGEFAIVAINSGSGPVTQIFDLGSFTAASVTPWITSETQSLAVQASIPVSGNTFQHLLPASSVVTYVGTATATQPDLAEIRLRLDETSGTTAPNSSIGANGTLGGGATWAAGNLNNAVSLDGTDDHVTLPTGVVSGLDDFTISCWVNLDTVSTWSRIFDFGTGTTNYMFLTPRHSNESGTLRFAIRSTGGTEQVITGPAPLSPAVWTHVAVTLSGTTGRLFVNGRFVGSNANMTFDPSDLGATTANYIGRSQFGSDPYLDGRVDEFQIFDRELSYWDIATLASPPAAPGGLTATPGNQQAVLSWSAVSGANGYNVRRSGSAGGPFSIIAEGVKTTGFTDTGLVNGNTYHYQVTALRDSAESASAAPVPATPVLNFAQWIAAAFPGQTNPGTVGPNADPDFDGYANLIEYFMATNPNASGSAGMVAASRDGSGNLMITFRMAKLLTGVSYSVQSSTGLNSWTDTGVTTTVFSDGGDHYLMRASIPTGVNTGFFLRVAVTGQ